MKTIKRICISDFGFSRGLRFALPAHKSRQIATRIHCVPSRKRYYSNEIRRSNSGADEDSRLLECDPA